MYITGIGQIILRASASVCRCQYLREQVCTEARQRMASFAIR